MRFASTCLSFLLPVVASATNLDIPVARFTATNPSDFPRPDALLRIPLADLGILPNEERAQWLVIEHGGQAIPTQLVDANADGTPDTLVGTWDLEAAATADFMVVADSATACAQPFPRRVQADLSIKVGGAWHGKEYQGGVFQNVASLVKPPQATDHSWFIRYEGPGLESDKIAYRFYLDWRNGYDIFGKSVHNLVLQDVGLDGWDSYHEPGWWGMDILKVGDALGIGSPGHWDGRQVERVSETQGLRTRIVSNGPVAASLDTAYTGWAVAGKRVDLHTVLTMTAGSRIVHVHATAGEPLDNLCTGIVKLPGAELIRSSTDRTAAAWAYVATWGTQSLNNDLLGMAIFFRVGDLKGVSSDADNQVVIFDGGTEWDYCFGAAWEKEPGGIRTREQFVQWLDQTVERLERPLRTSLHTGFEALAISDPLTPSRALDWSTRAATSFIGRTGGAFSYPRGQWRYTTGLIADATYRLGKFTGRDDIAAWGAGVIGSFVTPEGTLHSYRQTDYNLDQVNSGKMLLKLARDTGDPRYMKAAGLLDAQLAKHPRTSEGAFWHKQSYPWQVWLDGVYMAVPFHVAYLADHADTQAIPDAIKEFSIVEEHLRIPASGLYRHAWDEKHRQRWADPQTGLSPECWGRGMGWFAMALVDTLDYLPAGSPGHDTLVRIFSDLASALVRVQDPKSGVWYQIVDKPADTGNYLESSASSMFVYSLAKGIRMGYIDAPTYTPAALKGYQGLLDNFVRVEADGSVSIINCCLVAGFGRMDSYAYYMTEPVVRNDPKATGPFIMAGIEVARLLEQHDQPAAVSLAK